MTLKILLCWLAASFVVALFVARRFLKHKPPQ